MQNTCGGGVFDLIKMLYNATHYFHSATCFEKGRIKILVILHFNETMI